MGPSPGDPYHGAIRRYLEAELSSTVKTTGLAAKVNDLSRRNINSVGTAYLPEPLIPWETRLMAFRRNRAHHALRSLALCYRAV